MMEVPMAVTHRGGLPLQLLLATGTVAGVDPWQRAPSSAAWQNTARHWFQKRHHQGLWSTEAMARESLATTADVVDAQLCSCFSTVRWDSCFG